MILKYYTFTNRWNDAFDTSLDSINTLILVFGSSSLKVVEKPLQDIKKSFSHSVIIGASTAGEILMDELLKESVVVVVMKFKTTKVRLATRKIETLHDSFHIGAKIANELQNETLKSIFILSDGLNINGSQLTSGFNSVITPHVLISGGLAGDNSQFKSTWIIVNGLAQSSHVSAIGLYGDAIRIGYGSRGGWDIFGVKRKITASQDNIVYTLNDKPILDIYKKYLGEKAKDLPASGLLFPLGVYDKNNKIVVRTILAIDEARKSITFAGDIAKGATVSLMKSNNNRLIEAASNSSKEVDLQEHTDEPILNINISCIGRKLVLKQRAEEELEATLENLPPNTLQVGFYSYGEISPYGSQGCDLHNQTMTLTTIWEKNA